MEDTVSCAICGKTMTYINNRHLASHGITAAAYREQFPQSPMKTEAVSSRLSDRSVRSNETRRGIKRSDEDRAAIRSGIARVPSKKGIPTGPFSETHRENLSKSIKQTFLDGRIHHGTGKPVGETTKQKIREALIGVPRGPAAALKAVQTKRNNGYDFGKSARGRIVSDETKRKIAISGKKSKEEKEASRSYMLPRIEQSGLDLLSSLSEKVFDLKCQTCNHHFTRWSSSFIDSKWKTKICNQCFPVSPVSAAEADIAQYVRTLTENVVVSDRQTLARLELDIVLPDHKVAIEYCGIYWHSELAGKNKTYHRNKLDLCTNKGIRLITIFEDEWIANRDIVKSMIANLLGSNHTRISARQCRVEKIDSRRALDFIALNHIQGGGRSNVKYGLFLGDELVSVMTFSNNEVSRRSKGWDINRFCTKTGMSIRGGASKLFTAFVRDHDPEMVVSYADLRWGTGSVYGHLGFSHVGNTVPNYWYFKANLMTRIHRYGLRKRPEEPKDVTEWTLRQQEGWNRIWDCGHAKWVWEKSR